MKVEGDFIGEGSLVVEGIVVGNLTTKNSLRVGRDAVIEAEVKAKDALIAGRVTGNVTIKGKLELTASGQIHGNIKCVSLSVESGGVINGELTMAAETHPEKNLGEIKLAEAVEKGKK